MESKSARAKVEACTTDPEKDQKALARCGVYGCSRIPLRILHGRVTRSSYQYAQSEQKANICAKLCRVGNLRTCRASFHDPKGEGIFSVEISGESKYEVAIKALKAFRQESWSSEAMAGSGYLELAIKAPEIRYKIFLKDLLAWVEQTGGSPRDVALRAELKALLGM